MTAPLFTYYGIGVGTVTAAQFDGTAESGGAIEEWMKTGEYRHPENPGSDRQPSTVIVEREVKAGEWVVRAKTDSFFIEQDGLFEFIYKPAPDEAQPIFAAAAARRKGQG